VQEAVPADGEAVGHGLPGRVGVAAEDEHLVGARAAVEPVAERGDEGHVVDDAAARGPRCRQAIGEHLVDVIALAAPEQVGCVAVIAAGKHVVARSAEDPILAGAALQHVVALAAENHVAADRHRGVGERGDRAAGEVGEAGAEHEFVGAIGPADKRADPDAEVVARRGRARHLERVGDALDKAGHAHAGWRVEAGRGGGREQTASGRAEFERDRAGRVEGRSGKRLAVATVGCERERVKHTAGGGPRGDRDARDRGERGQSRRIDGREGGDEVDRRGLRAAAGGEGEVEVVDRGHAVARDFHVVLRRRGAVAL